MILFFAFILPLSKAGISILIFLFFLVWLIEGDFKSKYQRVKKSLFLKTIILFIIVSLVSILWTENIQNGLDKCLNTAYLFLIIIFATSLKKEYFPSIISAFLAGMLLSEIIAYGVFFEFWTFKHATVQNPSPFMHHIHYSVFLAFTSILLLNRIMSNRYSRTEKLFLLLFFISVVGNLFIGIGRTGQVALVAALFVMSILHFRVTVKSFFISLFLIVSIFSTAYNISDNFQKRVLLAKNDVEKITNMDFNSSWGIRVAYWITTFDYIKQNPFGDGLGDYLSATKETLEKNEYPFINSYTKDFMKKYHPHNQYLLTLLQLGFLGLLILFTMIYSLVKLNIEDNEIRELKILFMTIYFVSCMAEPLLILHFTIGLFIVFAGLFASAENFSKEIKYV